MKSLLEKMNFKLREHWAWTKLKCWLKVQALDLKVTVCKRVVVIFPSRPQLELVLDADAMTSRGLIMCLCNHVLTLAHPTHQTPPSRDLLVAFYPSGEKKTNRSFELPFIYLDISICSLIYHCIEVYLRPAPLLRVRHKLNRGGVTFMFLQSLHSIIPFK